MLVCKIVKSRFLRVRDLSWIPIWPLPHLRYCNGISVAMAIMESPAKLRAEESNRNLSILSTELGHSNDNADSRPDGHPGKYL